jgi:hypothetical protein
VYRELDVDGGDGKRNLIRKETKRGRRVRRIRDGV